MLHTAPHLETRLAELMMSQLLPCDLGDGIEVLHDVEAIEVELECDVDDPPVIDVTDITERMERIWFDGDDVGTHQFVRQSAPYERIELHFDERAYVRATIEEAKRLPRPRPRLTVRRRRSLGH